MTTMLVYAAAAVMFAALMAAYLGAEMLVRGRNGRADVKRRMAIEPVGGHEALPERKDRKPGSEIAGNAARRAADFYASTDPDNVMRLRQILIRAGYMSPDAVGRYVLARIVGVVGGIVIAVAVLWFFALSPLTTNGLMVGGMFVLAGYLGPTFVIMRRTSQLQLQYRSGFPDFMDLMIVCADAGLSLEASIERVSREIATTYPALSQNLVLVSLELRAGRPIDETLKALGDRLGLEEVRAFAMLLKQSKELGTSLSGTLKVFSDEMRHKRMSAAEEKAHALPAKMTIPVTMCILPVVLMMAIIPTIVRYSM